MLQVILDDGEYATACNLTTLYQIVQHIEDLLPVQAALNLVEAGLEGLEGHLVDAELTVAVCTVVDQKGVNLGELRTHKLENSGVFGGS